MEKKAKNPVKSVSTSLRILEQLAVSGEMGVSELTREVDATKGTVHNHLATLRQDGYVIKRGETYSLGSRLISFGASVKARSPLYRYSQEMLESLAQSTGESACIGVEEEDHVVYQRIVPEYAEEDRLVSEGTRIPLHCSALGKCLLADRSNEEIREYLEEFSSVEPIERTIVDSEELIEEIRTVREQNLGFVRGEYDEDLYEVATAVNAGTDQTRGAVGVFGPKERMSGKSLQQDTAGLVLNAAKQIEVAIHQSDV